MAPDARPFEGTAALTRLAGYCGVSPRERLYDLFDFVNVIETYPGKQPGQTKYDAFPAEAGLRGAQRVWAQVLDTPGPPWRHVVVLGRVATDAMRTASKGAFRTKDGWFQWESVWTPTNRRINVTSSPHPGGTSMWWNKAENLTKGRAFWTALAAQQSHDRRDLPAGTNLSDRKTEVLGELR